jgi:hypothetical protein
MDISDDPASPKDRRDSEQDSLHHTVNQLAIHSPKVDPALSMRSPSQVSSASTEQPGEMNQQSWVENIRTIERLRAYLKDRLDAHDYSDEEGESAHMKEERRPSDEAASLYPVLRAIQEGRE